MPMARGLMLADSFTHKERLHLKQIPPVGNHTHPRRFCIYLLVYYNALWIWIQDKNNGKILYFYSRMPRLLTARYTVDVGVILHPIYPTHIQYVNKTFDVRTFPFYT